MYSQYDYNFLQAMTMANVFTSLKNPSGQSCSVGTCNGILTYPDGSTTFQYNENYMQDLQLPDPTHQCTYINANENHQFEIAGISCDTNLRAVCQYDCTRDKGRNVIRCFRYTLTSAQKNDAMANVLTLTSTLPDNVEIHVMACAQMCQRVKDSAGNALCNGFAIHNGICHFGIMDASFVQNLDSNGDEELYYVENM